MSASAVEVDYRESCRVLVCGGRKYAEQNFLFYILDTYHENKSITLIIEGGASGADALARTWAILRKVEYKTFPAEWSKFGLAAGRMRNKQMLDEGKPDLVIAFKGGPGTENMKEQTFKAKIPLRIFDEPFSVDYTNNTITIDRS